MEILVCLILYQKNIFKLIVHNNNQKHTLEHSIPK